MTSRGAGPKRWAALCLPLALVVLATASAPPANAAVSCSFEPTTGALALELTSGSALALTREGGLFEVDGSPLGACAPDSTPVTLEAANSLSITDGVAGQGTQFTLDLGPEDPGLGFEPLVLAGDGDDVLGLLDGVAERATCGPGDADTVVADDPGVDSLSATCEQVNLAPGTTVVDGPADGASTNQTLSAYQLAASEPASFQLSVDGAPFSACSEACAAGPLTDGAHDLRFRAVDATSLVERTPATRTIVIDTYIRTAIRKAPQERSARVRALYRFRAEEPDPEDPARFTEEPGATFVCGLDKRPLAPCISPKRYRGLRRGRHTFTVIATDEAGNVDADPAVDTFRVTRPKQPRR
jgi:hypothetical protein